MKSEIKTDMKISNEIENIVGKENIKYNEPMSKHTSFKVGGPADMFVECDSQEKLVDILTPNFQQLLMILK